MLLILRRINHFGGNGLTSHSPPDANDEVDLRLRGYVEVTRCARSPLQANLLLLLVEVLLHVRLRALEDDLALGLRSLKSSNQVSTRQDMWRKICKDQSRKMVCFRQHSEN